MQKKIKTSKATNFCNQQKIKILSNKALGSQTLCGSPSSCGCTSEWLAPVWTALGLLNALAQGAWTYVMLTHPPVLPQAGPLWQCSSLSRAHKTIGLRRDLSCNHSLARSLSALSSLPHPLPVFP